MKYHFLKAMRTSILVIFSFFTLLFFSHCGSDDETMEDMTEDIDEGDDDEEPEIPTIGAPTAVQTFDIGNAANSSDIRVFFRAGTNSSFVEEYRIILSNESSSANLNIETALGLAEGRYYSLTTSATLPKFNLSEGITDFEGNEIAEGVTYQAFILAVPNDEEIEPKLSEVSTSVTLTQAELRDLYVTSRGTNSVEMFDRVTGEHLGSFVIPNSSGLSAPQEVIFLEDGNLLVTGRFNTSLKLYDGETGVPIRDFTSGYSLNEPTKTSIGPDGYLYVSQWHANVNPVVRFNLETGEFIDEVVPSFFQGMDQAWDSQGNMYVVSWGLAQLRKYSPEFELLESTSSNLSGPVNIWVDENDVLFVVDWTTGSVKKFDTDLNFIETFISGFVNVEGYVFEEDKILLCDWQLGTIKIHDRTTGDLIETLVQAGVLENPNSITFGPDKRPFDDPL